MAAGWWQLPALGLAVAACLHVAIAVHEAAHALAARAGRLRVPMVAVGCGPLLLRAAVRGTIVELRLLPLFGEAVVEGLDLFSPAPTRASARRHCLVDLCVSGAGPLASIGFGLGLLYLYSLLPAGGKWGVVQPPPDERVVIGFLSTFLDGVRCFGSSPSPALLYAAVLNLGMGTFNLLPILPLDGGRLVLAIYQAVFVRPIPIGFVRAYFATGVCLLGLVVAVLLAADVRSLRRHGAALRLEGKPDRAALAPAIPGRRAGRPAGSRRRAWIKLAVLTLFGVLFALGYTAGQGSAGAPPPAKMQEPAPQAPPEAEVEPVCAPEGYRLI
jgi:Zn-dependent protease